MKNNDHPYYNYIFTTFIFCIIGLFAPAISMLLISGFQLLISTIRISCEDSWHLIWAISWIGLIIWPILFFQLLYIKKSSEIRKIKNRLIWLNTLGYLSIQISVGSLLSSAEILCYGIDGQIGLEYVFTAWLALPILFLFSVILDRLLIKQIS